MATFARDFLDTSGRILAEIDDEALEAIALELAATRARGGRLFLCGSGGGAGHASHAACDFRKLAHIESYCVTDNVSELTARVNDDGWDSSYANWLRASQLPRRRLPLRVLGRRRELGRRHQHEPGATRWCSRERSAHRSSVSSGATAASCARCATACVVIPNLDDRFVTPQTEGMQALMWHLVVSHPSLAAATAKWEGVSETTASDHHPHAAAHHARRRRHRRARRTTANHGGGFLIAAAITKYVFIAVNRNFDGDVMLKYSQVERVPSAADAKHPLLREILLVSGAPTGIEISAMADIPAGTGLGSSGCVHGRRA